MPFSGQTSLELEESVRGKAKMRHGVTGGEKGLETQKIEPKNGACSLGFTAGQKTTN